MNYQETFLGFLLYVSKPSNYQFSHAGPVFLVIAIMPGTLVLTGASRPGSQST